MMLANRGHVDDILRLQQVGSIFDLKIDGVRCLATIEDGTVSLESRQKVTITGQYPEVVGVLAGLRSGLWVLDGEIAVNDEQGLPSWPLTAKRNAQTRFTAGWAAKLPATYYVFDVLVADGEDVRGKPLTERREILAGLDLTMVLSTTDGAALWDVVMQHRLEGIVAKRPSSRYHSGRSSDWVKIKHTQTVTCLVGGFDPGEGSRASTFGALHLYLLNDKGEPVQVGKVGSGFSDRELREVMRVLHHPDLLTQPPLIVEVEYLDFSPGGLLRQPVFQRVRRDASVAECTLEQLTPVRRRT